MGSILRRIARPIRKVIELRRLARSTKSAAERNTALAVAAKMVGKHKLDEDEIRAAERVAATQTDEDVTVLLDGDMARTLWSMGVAEAIASVHGLIRYQTRAPPTVFVIGAEGSRELCQSDVETVIATMRARAVPHSVASYHYLSYLEGMAWGFGSTVENARKTLAAKAGTMVVRPVVSVIRRDEDEDDDDDDNDEAPPPQPPVPPLAIIRPDPKIAPNPDLRRQGSMDGVALAYKYVAARIDKEGRTIGLALRWKR